MLDQFDQPREPSLMVVDQCCTARLPVEADGTSGSGSLTPALIAALPDPLRLIVVGAYNEALVAIFLFMVPLDPG